MTGRRGAAATAVLLAAALGGCTTSGHGATGSSTSEHGGPTHLAVAHPLDRRPTALASGFSAPGTDTPPSVAALTVLPTAALDPKALRRAPAPSGLALKGALAAVINQPVPVEARALLVSTTAWSAGGHVTVVAAANTGTRHDVLFILQGPGYRGERLVACRDGLAAGVVVLPSPLAAGTWYVAVQDLSALRSTPQGQVTGTALVGLGMITVP